MMRISPQRIFKIPYNKLDDNGLAPIVPTDLLVNLNRWGITTCRIVVHGMLGLSVSATPHIYTYTRTGRPSHHLRLEEF